MQTRLEASSTPNTKILCDYSFSEFTLDSGEKRETVPEIWFTQIFFISPARQSAAAHKEIINSSQFVNSQLIKISDSVR
jgi:hypothetical protein